MSQQQQMEAALTEFFTHNPDHRYKSREIARLLHYDSQQDYRVFQGAIRTLVAAGNLVESPRKYFTAPGRSHTVQGRLQINRRGFGFVIVEGNPDDIFVEKSNLGTALNGDTVTAEVFGKHKGQRRAEGRILSVTERKTTVFCGTYRDDTAIPYVIPEGNLFRRDFMIPSEHTQNANNNDKVVVELLQWENQYVNPEARITRVLGPPDTPRVDLEMVARSFGVEIDFPDAVVKETEHFPAGLTQKEIARRLDLRDVMTMTIDPEDAKDFDDAISLEILPNGHRQLGVHIADVTHYVREGTQLDQEARDRATSIYMPGWCIPMLPPRLSEDLCSLRPDVDRPALTILMELDSNAKVINAEFHESVIHSNARLTYQRAQTLIDGKSQTAIAIKLREIKTLADQLRTRRMKNGGLDFDLPEIIFMFDPSGMLVDIRPKPHLATHALVEECMLLTNVTAVHLAHDLSQRRGGQALPFIYRIHGVPDPVKMKEYIKFLRPLGIKVPPSSQPTSKLFQKILKSVDGKPEKAMVEEMTLRTMQKAIYDTVNVGHFGLAFKEYTHFTSPIRRYSDLLVHRLLKSFRGAIAADQADSLRENLPVWCQHMSHRERRAMEIEREAVKMKQIEFLKDQVGDEFNGVISGVVPFGLFIELEGILAEGLIHIRDLKDDYYRHDEARYALIGERHGKEYRLAGTVRVKLIRVDQEDRKLDMVLISDEADDAKEIQKAKEEKTNRKPRKKRIRKRR